MPRKKKTEEVKEEVIIEKKEQPVDYGTGWVRINNMLQAGFTMEEIMGGKKNE